MKKKRTVLNRCLSVLTALLVTATVLPLQVFAQDIVGVNEPPAVEAVNTIDPDTTVSEDEGAIDLDTAVAEDEGAINPDTIVPEDEGAIDSNTIVPEDEGNGEKEQFTVTYFCLDENHSADAHVYPVDKGGEFEILNLNGLDLHNESNPITYWRASTSADTSPDTSVNYKPGDIVKNVSRNYFFTPTSKIDGSYTATFNFNGGMCGVQSEFWGGVTYNEGEKIALAPLGSMHKKGYSFLRWDMTHVGEDGVKKEFSNKETYATDMPAVDTLFTAIWEEDKPNTFKVTYLCLDKDHGDYAHVYTVNKGESFTIRDRFDLYGHDDSNSVGFWYLENDSQTPYIPGATVENVQRDYTFSPCSTNVGNLVATFNLDGGKYKGEKEYANVKFSSGGALSLPNPGSMTKDGHTFNGWKMEPSKSEYDKDTRCIYNMPDNNVTLTAQWIATGLYVATFDLNGGKFDGSNGYGPLNFEAGKGISLPTASFMIKDGFYLQGWKMTEDDNPNTAPVFYDRAAQYTHQLPAANVKFTAQWVTLDEYQFKGELEWWRGEDTADRPANIEFTWSREKPYTFVNPTIEFKTPRPGYEFVRWNLDDVCNVSGEESVYFYPGDTTKKTVDSKLVISDATLIRIIIERNGVLKGYGEWKTAEAETLTAKFSPNGGSIADGFGTSVNGSPTRAISFTNGQEFNFADVSGKTTRSDFKLIGWQKDGTSTVHKIDDVINMPSDDVSFTAQWVKKDEIVVTYEAGDVSEELTLTAPEGIKFGAANSRVPDVALSIANAPSYQHHEFAGWKLKGTETVYKANEKVSFKDDVTLVAQWNPISYPVTYLDSDVDGKAIEKLSAKIAFKENQINMPEGSNEFLPKKTNFKLLGFIANVDLGSYTAGTAIPVGTKFEDVPLGKAIVFTPKFAATAVTIRFIDYTGTVFNTQNVAIGEMPVEPRVTPKPADKDYTYTFSKWDKTIVRATVDTDYTAWYDSHPKIRDIIDPDKEPGKEPDKKGDEDIGENDVPTGDGETITITLPDTETPRGTPPAAVITPETVEEVEIPQALPEEKIEEDEIPQALPEETIKEEEIPQAPGAGWALLNLILMALTAVGSVILLVGYFARKKDEDGNRSDDTKHRRILRLLSIIPAVGAVVAFVLTENMNNPMAIIDKWTILMVVIAVVQAVVMFFSKKKIDKDAEDNNTANANA